MVEKATNALRRLAGVVLGISLSIGVSMLPTFGAAAEPERDFSTWLEEFKAQARAEGIGQATLETAFAEVREPIARVIELDRSQPEFMQTFSGYLSTRLSQARIERGRRLLGEYRDLFDSIYREYGVQPHYLVSFWALESNFGDYTGGFSVINALATLAYDPRRAAMFRGELMNALRIIDQGHIPAEQMSGSWAGAMGQCQFMPSTFLAYARDGDGDGRIDIWGSVPDVMTSAANFLAASGWKGDERWGREVLLPEGFDFDLSGLSIRKTVSEWNALGLRKVDGSPLGNADMQASVVLPSGAAGPAFLTYNNFRTTMVWNRSTYYAITVGHLADRFTGGPEIVHMPESEERPLARDDVIQMQELLNELGHDVGTADGILGSRTRDGVKEFQMANDLPADGHPSHDLLQAMREAGSL